MKHSHRVYLFSGMFAWMAVGAFGQEWYAGAKGGYGFAPSVTVKGPSGTADTGLNNGYAAGAFVGADTYRYWSTEVGYLYRQSDLKLQSGGTSVHFAGHSQIIHFDSLWHFRPRGSKIRPFVAAGVGANILSGTGEESASQPLGRLAALTNASEATAVGDVGIGVKATFHKSWQLSVDVHDFISPLPKSVIAPGPGASIRGWLNDIIPAVSIAYHW